MISARISLQMAYSIFLTSPENLDYERPKQGYEMLRKKRNATTYRNDAIIKTPRPTCHASESFSGRTSTTHRCATLIMQAAPLIRAAENQSEIKSRWLQFAYDPYMDINRDARNEMRYKLIPLIFCVWAFAPKQRRPDLDNPVRLVRLVDLCIDDCARRFRTDKAQQDTSLWWRQLGYDSSASAQWNRSWARHAEDIYAVIDRLDREALAPVVRTLAEQERRREGE